MTFNSQQKSRRKNQHDFLCPDSPILLYSHLTARKAHIIAVTLPRRALPKQPRAPPTPRQGPRPPHTPPHGRRRGLRENNMTQGFCLSPRGGGGEEGGGVRSHTHFEGVSADPLPPLPRLFFKILPTLKRSLL